MVRLTKSIVSQCLANINQKYSIMLQINKIISCFKIKRIVRSVIDTCKIDISH